VGVVRVKFKPIYAAFAGLAFLFAGFYGILYVMIDADHRGVWETLHALTLTISIILWTSGLQLLSWYLCTPEDD
jgi:hypothetical protein